jgi:steroid delta-isomerase-like uncharacterized protein
VESLEEEDTMSQQSLIDAAKALIVAYGEKDWDAVRAASAPDLAYDEVATQRKIRGVDQVIVSWQGWAAGFPDSRATFDSALASGQAVVLEVTWRGTHTGPLRTPAGQFPPTGRSIEIRACQVFEISGGKVQSMRHYFDMATLMQQLGAAA